jgi:hypothetical protein
MRFFSVLAASLLIFAASTAFAGNRVFIIANPPTGDGIDRCLASGEKCGAQAAHSYCKSREFAQATAYRRVDPDEVTGSVPKTAGQGCPDGSCNEYVAIICRR